MVSPTDQQHLHPFLHQIGIDPSGDTLTVLNELMNITLQCLGSIRILSEEYEQTRKGKYTVSLYHGNSFKEQGWGFWALRKSFEYAVKRYMQHIMIADEIHNLDPSRHILESFPNKNTVNQSSWLAAHWAILGDPDLHTFCEESHQIHRFTTESSTSHQTSNSVAIDERIILVDEISRFIPSTVSEVDKEGRTVLHIAARLDSVPLFECTLENTTKFNGKTIKDINKNGALPLHNTARFCQYPDVYHRVLKEYPEALEFLNIEQMLPLHWAAVKNKSVDIVKSLIELYPVGLHSPNSEGYLPMHCAGQNNCLEVVKAIYSAYPQAIQIPDNEGGLPLHHACCFKDNFDVIKFIYEAYPEAINIPQQDLITPIHLASSQNNSVELFKFILHKSPNAARLKDRDNWVATDCLLNNIDHHLSVQSLECLHSLLKANPEVTTTEWIQRKDFITRTILKFNPTINYALYRELNWTARKTAVWVVVKLAGQMTADDQSFWNTMKKDSTRFHTLEYIASQSNPTSQQHLFKSNSLAAYVEKQVHYDLLRAKVLKKLCQYFMAHDAVEIPAGILQKIVKFL